MKTVISLFVLVVVVVLITKSLASAYDEVTPQELKEMMAKGGSGFTILDVREADEVADCKIPKSVHIPLAEVGKRAKELDPGKEIIAYCAAGVRSARASKVLDGAGFKKVKNLKGGIRGWISAGGAVEGPCR